jgi:hypothetical protein
MEDFTTWAALAALAIKVTSLIKYMLTGQVRQSATTVVPWLAAFAVLMLGSQADATSAIMLPGLNVALGHADIASLMLAATALGSTGSVVHDFTKAVDNTQSAAEPKLGAFPDG